MPLLTYAQARPWAKSIKAALLSGKMPPWQADPHYGKFSNDLSLAPGEKETAGRLDQRRRAGGQPGGCSQAENIPEGWRIPKPDVVFEMPVEFNVPASGEVNYQYIAVPTNFTEDKWVETVEVRPGNRAVVHHAIVVIDSADDYQRAELSGRLCSGNGSAVLETGASSADQGRDRGWCFRCTMRPTGSRRAIGPKSAWCSRRSRRRSGLSRCRLPRPGSRFRREMRIIASAVLRQTIENLLSGRHARAHAPARQIVHVPGSYIRTGSTEILLDIPHYDFNWQPYYYLETPKLLPRGTRIEAHAVFDNSANNPFNPNPDGDRPLGTADLG